MCILVVSRYDGLMVHSLCYYFDDRWGREHEGVVAVIQWMLTEHYQEGSVSEELLKEMLFWSCRYVCTYFSTTYTNGTCIYTCHCFSMYPPVVGRKDVVE